MKVCSHRGFCHNDAPQPLAAFPKHRTARDGRRGYCKVCERGMNRAYYRKNKAELNAKTVARRRNNGGTRAELTSTEERSEDGYKCLALDVLMLAISDHAKGQCEPEFWNSPQYELFCDAAGLHPDWIRRNVLEQTA